MNTTTAEAGDSEPGLTVWTIGHSTRPIEEFLGLLAQYRIDTIADVRSFPGSRKYPQYGKEALGATLAAHALGYHWLQALGGRRRVSPDSPNTAWRNASFRGYADYMASGEFAQGLDHRMSRNRPAKMHQINRHRLDERALLATKYIAQTARQVSVNRSGWRLQAFLRIASASTFTMRSMCSVSTIYGGQTTRFSPAGRTSTPLWKQSIKMS